MAEYTVTADSKKIDLGATGVNEVLQNVRMIISTVEFSCPMHRDFAYNPAIDAPVNIAQARQTARMVEAIRKYEPRAQVVKVDYVGDAQNGVLKPVVKVRVEDDDT